MASKRDTKRDKLIERTIYNQQQILQAKLTRRDLLKMGLLSSTGLLIAKQGLSFRALAAINNCGPSFDPLAPCVSNLTVPFTNPLHIPPLAKPSSADALTDTPTDASWAAATPVKVRAPQFSEHKGCKLSDNANPTKVAAKYYRQDLDEAQWDWDVANAGGSGPHIGGLDTAWVFDGSFPGTTFIARHKEPVFIRRFNCLNEKYVTSSTTPIPGGFGSPWSSTHLHNFHSADQSDGGPWENRRLQGGKNGLIGGKEYIDGVVESCQMEPPLDDPTGPRELTFGMFGPGDYHDYHYSMLWAGFTNPATPYGDEREALNTMWYHDHCKDYTSQNVYKGMAGMFLVHDDKDTGDETTGWRLPSGYGVYDVPLVLSDRMFDRSGNSVFPLFNLDGVIGDKYTVNGRIQPKLRVKTRRYRFRVLGIGPSRVYRVAIVAGNPDGSNISAPIRDAMCIMSNQGNFLEFPVITDRINVCPAERFDILVDFKTLDAKFPGKSFFLANLMEQTDGRGPTYKDMSKAGLLMRFDVDGPATDGSFNYFAATGTIKRTKNATGAVAWVNRAWKLLDKPPRPTEAQLKAQGVVTNTFKFDRSNGNWTVNGRIFNEQAFNGDPTIKKPKNGETQIWVIKASGNWTHPVHIHFEEGQVITHNGVPAATVEAVSPFDDRGRLFTGRRDVFCIGNNDEMRVAIRFRDYTGQYPMHCHNVVHEDHAMMMRFDIEN